MENIDLKKFICSLIGFAKDNAEDNLVDYLNSALLEQGLEYKDGEIVKTQRRVAAEAKEALYTAEVESEDEKVRKWLIETINYIPNSSIEWDVIEKAKVLAWLEKQKYTQRDVDDAYLKGITDTKNILENRGKQTNFFQNVSLTEFEEALADVCRGWIGEEIGWKDYIIRNANALLKICQKMWNEVQNAPFEQKPIKMWHDVSEVPDEMQELLVEWESPDATWHNIAFYDAETKAFRHLKQPINNVTRWAYVSDVLAQSVTKTSDKGWSEEDEDNLRYFELHFKTFLTNTCYDTFCNWLKSLKDRLKGE